MQIEYVDAKITRVAISSLSIGDVFSMDDGFNDVCLCLGVSEKGKHKYIILGEYPELNFVEEDVNVRKLKAKLVVEI